MSTIIEAKDLTYKYPEAAHRALKGVSLSVEKGEKLAILGPNGCGKSTLAKLMNALYTPTSGSLTVAGLD
ncbi:MAG: ATP-binding cassette domain-containing protein, partial [bacterium]|nr:ATP-binding cassette domain-containing protein [bacterium]